MAQWSDEVLDFWFGELGHEDRFGGAPEVDDKIRQRFGELHAELASAIPARALEDPSVALAAIIVYDQFPRNLFRRKPEAFGTDALALSVARNALDREFDHGMPDDRKMFFYMPFMHSEVLADQERCVDLIRAMGNEEGVKYAEEHRDIVARYGRFPHRNRALGRQSTPDELEFLKTHSGYGQGDESAEGKDSKA